MGQSLCRRRARHLRPEEVPWDIRRGPKPIPEARGIYAIPKSERTYDLEDVKRRLEVRRKVEEAKRQRRADERFEKRFKELQEETATAWKKPEIAHPCMKLHDTGVPRHKLSDPGTGFYPVFQHDRRKSMSEQTIRFMTPDAVDQTYGPVMGTAGRMALLNLTAETMCFEGMSLHEVFRHLLCLYCWRPLGSEAPVDEIRHISNCLNTTSRGFECLPLRLIDRAKLAEKTPEVRCSVGVMPATTKDGSPCHYMCVMIVLTKSMDIWHSANARSPASPSLLKHVQKVIAKFRRDEPIKGALIEKVENGELESENVLEVIAAPAPCRRTKRQKAQQRKDDEFLSLQFEDVLRQEKEDQAKEDHTRALD